MDTQDDILKAVETIEGQAVACLRRLIAIPSESGKEGAVVAEIAKTMKALDYDEVLVDGMGNVLGRVGSGPRVIAFDGHIDTVGVGDPSAWHFDPFDGKEDDDYVYGRGTSDQTGGFVCALYAMHLAKKMGLLDQWTVWVVGSVQEEDCDGLCWQYILKEKVIAPECVILTEPTSLGIYRGQRGRMEIRVEITGLSAHGSAPERGKNAIFEMGHLLGALEGLAPTLKDHAFLGKGTLTVSEIFYTSPSRCAVADSCAISIDRRLTAGETESTAIAEIKRLAKEGTGVALYDYEKPSHTGLVQKVPCYFPSWVVPEDFWGLRRFEKAFEKLWQEKPRVDKWTFSTNGVSIMGMFGIPCVGFGPGDESEAHAPNEKIRKSDLTKAMATYIGFIEGDKEDVYVSNA